MPRDIAGYPTGASESRSSRAVLCHVTRSRSAACVHGVTSRPMMTTSVGHVYKYVRSRRMIVRARDYTRIRAPAAMCRIHVAPSRRPSDVLLSSRNSALHSYRITYMLCAPARTLVLVLRIYVRAYACAGAPTTGAHAQTDIHTHAESRRGWLHSWRNRR